MTADIAIVDEGDHEIGACEKLDAHRAPAPLHRAFSVFAFDSEHRLLIQRRSRSKYHFAGMWANTCCGHPRPGAPVIEAAAARCWEEMRICPLSMTDIGTVIYRADDPVSHLQEHELDHVIVGSFHGSARPNPLEVAESAVLSIDEITARLERQPEMWAPWLPPTLEVVRAWIGEPTRS